jgi:hypothetical protein
MEKANRTRVYTKSKQVGKFMYFGSETNSEQKIDGEIQMKSGNW